MNLKRRKRIVQEERARTKARPLQKMKWQMRLLDSYPGTPSQKSQRGCTGHLDLLSPSSSELESHKKEKENVTISRMSALLKILLLER